MMTTDNRRRNRILTLLFVGVLMSALDIAIVGPALPAIQETFDIGDRALAWVFNLYVLFYLIGTPLMAKLSDRFGRRDIYILDVGLFAVGSLIVAASPSYTVLLVGRAVQALGAGGVFPVASAVIGDTFPQEKRGSALGLIGAVFGVAFLVGPILGGLLLEVGWQWLFLINLPVAAWLVWQSLRLLPTSRPETSRPFDWAGVGTLAVALGSVGYGLSRLDSSDLAASLLSFGVGPFLLLGLALLPLFWSIEKRAADPLLGPSLLAKRQLGLAGAFAAGAGLGEASLVFLPSLAVAAFGLSESNASFLLLPVVIALGVGSPLVGRLLDRVGSKVVVQGGLAISAVGLVLMSRSGSSLMLFIIAGAVIGLGLSALLGAPLRYIVLNEAGAGERASAQGIITVFSSIGRLIGGALVGAVAASQSAAAGYHEAQFVIGLLIGLLFFVAFGLKGREVERRTAQPQHA